MKWCPSCKAEYPEDKKFCRECGGCLSEKPQPPIEAGASGPPCPSCHQPVPAGSRFCRQCGHRLFPAAPGFDPEPDTRPLGSEKVVREQTPAHAPKRFRPPVLAVLALAAVALAGTGWFSWGKGGPTQPSPRTGPSVSGELRSRPFRRGTEQGTSPAASIQPLRGIDLNHYCRARGFAAAEPDAGSASGWACSPGGTPIDFGKVCKQQYGARFTAARVPPQPGGASAWECAPLAPAAPSGHIPSIDARVTDLRFFLSGNDHPSWEEQEYGDRFGIAMEERYILWELSLTHPARDMAQELAIRHIWYRPDGSIIAERDNQGRLQPRWTHSRHRGHVLASPGDWPPGDYRVELLVDGTPVAEGSFALFDAGESDGNLPAE